ncbi:molybdopterin-dependent oxidoreductase [Chloroflexota bacterium]
MKSGKARIYEDKWIPTVCGRCYGGCAIRVRRVNGIAVKIEGEPDSLMGASGGLCAKGAAGLQVLYDPNRLNVPLRRTNPEKGLYIDPEWKEITWDEALDEIATRLKRIMDDDPTKFLYQSSVLRATTTVAYRPFLGAIGAPRHNTFRGGASLHCGGGSHPVAGQVFSSWSIVPDFKYCNYALFFGASKGTAAGHSPLITARLRAEASVGGMKTVVFDPMCNFAGGKATEWVPIVPGTDAAVILAMCNVIVNELGTWDTVYLRTKTNGPYLVGPDLRYVRDKGTHKPLVWDLSEEKAVPYDYKSIPDYTTARTIDYALEGEYEVNGIRCHPAFQLVRNDLKQWSLERASEISTVLADTIKRIATEFVQAAKVGSTIVLEGKELPYRPASAVIFRGGQGHENSYHTCFAVALLNQIVGSADVPGGTLGWPARILGLPETGKLNWSPYMGTDGFIETDHFGPGGAQRRVHGPWPKEPPEKPRDVSLISLFPCAHSTPIWGQRDQEEIWQKFEIPSRIEMIISWGCNSVMNTANWETAEQALKRIPFIVVSEIFSTELAEGFADILLPDTCYLEQSSWTEVTGFNFNYPFGMEDWCSHITQPVIKPKAERRDFIDVMYQIAQRMGLQEKYTEVINSHYELDEDLKFGPTDIATWLEVSNRMLQNLFGREHNWEWFKEHGFIRWPKKIEEAYWRYVVDARAPIYMEYMVDFKEKLEEITKQTDFKLNLEQYTPFISWFPCTIHKVATSEYDLYCFSYRDILHSGTTTMEQPWLDEVSRINPYTYTITMNRDVAERKGINDGDTIEIESVYGRKVQGEVKLIEGQHPQTIGIAACSGHWAQGTPIAKDKGTNFNMLIELDMEHLDPTCLNIETAVRVKVNHTKEKNKEEYKLHG